MSVAELKQAVEGLSPGERVELAAHLRQLAKQDDPQWGAELEQRLNRCLTGGGHSSEELLALHDKLSTDAR